MPRYARDTPNADHAHRVIAKLRIGLLDPEHVKPIDLVEDLQVLAGLAERQARALDDLTTTIDAMADRIARLEERGT